MSEATADAPGGEVFTVTVTVRFKDCDVAGIVFYPRYIEMLNGVVEEWFDRALALPWHEMHLTHRRGVPIADLHVAFHRASRLGDVLDFRLRVARLGRSSFDLLVAASCQGEPRLEAAMTLVFCDLEGPQSVPLPPALRARMTAFGGGADL